MDSINIAVSERDIRQVWSWNSKVPEPIDTTVVHSLISKVVKKQPEAKAVEAWDGELSYAQFDSLSTRLAFQLHNRGVRPGINAPVIPLCLEKSKWTSIAMLGVMKAGGISTALDVNQPTQRLATIVQQTEAAFILCSASTRHIAESIGGSAEVFAIDHGQETTSPPGEPLPLPSPEQTLFITFTSGSTGVPKGACISHANVCAAVHHQGQSLGFPGARVLDYAPYSFDVSWSNMLHTFCAGGCLCIPSTDDMLNDLAGCMEQYAVTLINITPTILRTLDRTPHCLRDVLLSGESPGRDLLARWASKVRLKVTYGPSESTWKSCFVEMTDDTQAHPANIGKGVGAVTWLVDPENHDRLVAIGEVGELWLEGPLVGKGYLHDVERNEAAFVMNPIWLLRGGPEQPGREGRLYRTGDLVRYHADGSLLFVGRKDLQLKIRGSRVELQEIEHHIRRCLPRDDALEVAVDATTPQDHDEVVLVAFLTAQNTEELPERLVKVLPRQIVPIAYMHVQTRLPRTASGKTDRKRLREMAASLTLKQLVAHNGNKSQKQPPKGAMEQQLQHLWSKVLGIAPISIGAQDRFFQLGDSVKAIRLVGAAREQGLSFTVADVFRLPTLCDLAKVVREDRSSRIEHIMPFSLIHGMDEDLVKSIAAEACGVDMGQIKDVFPCTPFQAGLMSLTVQRPGEYVSSRRFEMKASVDLDRFRSAWNKVIKAVPILRTRVISLADIGLQQVVIRDPPEWKAIPDAEPRDQRILTSMGLGTPLTHFALLSEQQSGRRFFQWTMHHAVFDGWARSLILQMALKEYEGVAVPFSPPFQLFVRHLATLEEDRALEAWKEQLKGTTAQIFPPLPSWDYHPRASTSANQSIKDISWPVEDVTPATIIQAAWAILIQKYTDGDDVVFGAVMTGRDLPLAGLECIIGPTATTIPIKVALDRRDAETIRELLSRLQKQNLDIKPFEQIGLSRIRGLGPEAEQACRFQTLLVVHPVEEARGPHDQLFDDERGNSQESNENSTASTYALMIECQLRTGALQINAHFDPAVVSHTGMMRMLRQFEAVLRQLSQQEMWDHKIAEVNALSEQDLTEIRCWNKILPEPADECVHHLLTKVARKHSYAPAIHAWDGTVSYTTLDVLSTRVAQHLVQSLHVVPDDIVPICCKKSLWTSVAVLGIVKAGAASTLFDVTQPEKRLRDIMDQVQPRVLLASATNVALAKRLAPDSSVINVESMAEAKPSCPSLERFIQPSVKPDNILCVLFTSGSSGKSKGIEITHRTFSSALVHQNKALGFNQDSRVFDFASYAFDAAYYNLFHTLYAGACLCVPSEVDRHEDVSGSICRLGATFANLTPRLAETLDEHALQQLTMLELSGETADTSSVTRMRQYTNVRFAYGPAECTVMSTVSTSDAAVTNIGRGLGICCWVVSKDTTALVPVGCIGELWIEGALVGQGYFKDATRTEKSFVANPEWLKGAVNRLGTLYRTGDLVRYTSDGSLEFLGRKDNQRKLRGQRIELDEVTHHVRQCLGDHSPGGEEISVLAEIAVPRGGGPSQLVAFVIPPGALSMRAEEIVKVVGALTVDTRERMALNVPSYMIPSFFIPLERAPLTATGKIDRQHLRTVVEEFQQLLSPATAVQEPLTATEIHLRGIWAKVLKIKEHVIDRHCPFWSVGDSITAMSILVAIRKDFGVQLSIGSLVKHSTTLTSLSELIENKQRGLSSALDQATNISADLGDMTRLLKMLIPSSLRERDALASAKGSIVLLTGCTGFLGNQILRDLLYSQGVQKVVVLVRATDAKDGLARVQRTAKIAGWWSDTFVETIEAWPGDLSQHRLGLKPCEWDRLAARASMDVIDTVIHNGAAVHWTSDYAALKAVNVGSTFQLMKVAMQSPALRRFVYVSGGRASSLVDIVEDESSSGYVRTKYVSEKMVLTVADHPSQQRNRFAVVKPGLIIGGAETGIANIDDFLWRYVRSCIKLRVRPDEPSNYWLPVAEVTTVAAQVVRQATASECQSFTEITQGLSIESLWKAVEAGAGVHVSNIDMASWKELMQKDIHQAKETHPLWPVQQFIGPLGIVRADKSQKSPMVEPEGDSLVVGRNLQQAVIRNVQYLMGVLDASETAVDPQPEFKNLMTRTRRI